MLSEMNFVGACFAFTVAYGSIHVPVCLSVCRATTTFSMETVVMVRAVSGKTHRILFLNEVDLSCQLHGAANRHFTSVKRHIPLLPQQYRFISILTCTSVALHASSKVTALPFNIKMSRHPDRLWANVCRHLSFRHAIEYGNNWKKWKKFTTVLNV